MAFDSPPAFMDGTTLDAEVIRRATGTLISPAGGIVSPGDLAVAQQTVPNMSVQIGVGQVWVPGTSTATQGPYYSRNGAAITQAINAASASNPRVDIVGVQVQDLAYAGALKQIAPFYVAGTPTAGATLANLAGIGAVPASSIVLAYVLVPTSATSIVTADISAMIAPVCGRGTTGWQALTLTTGWTATIAQARLEGDVVRLRGAITNATGGASEAPATIPVGLRPARPVGFGAAVDLGLSTPVPAGCEVVSNGALTAALAGPTGIPNTDVLLLDGCTYTLG